MLTITGMLPGDTLKGREKFRATWELTLAQLLTPANVDAARVALQVRDALPSVGCYAVSNPSAAPGDRVLVYDVRVQQAAAGMTVAQFADGLERLPMFSGGWATHLHRLDLVAEGASAGELASGQEAARTEGNKEAASTSLGARIGDALKSAGLVLAVVAGLVGLVFLKGRKGGDW